jgi:serine/threonine-protein kinase
MLDYLKIFILLIAVAVVSGVIVMKVAIFQAGEPISAPDVVGKEIIPALESLDKAGLYLKIVRLEFSPTAPKDRIISQNPPPGETIKKGRDVRVVISRGSKNVIIPSLVGSSLLRAESVMAKNGIKIRKRIKVYSEKSEGEILAQKPAPQTTLVRGDAMTLLVSAGAYPEYLMTPEFVDQPVASTMERIKELDLKMSRVTYETSDKIERGIVLSQSPPFGARTLKGSFVSMVVSKGAAETSEEPATFSFLYYTIPGGPSAVSVSITQENDDGEKEVYHRIHQPEDTISLLVQVKGETIVKIFMDDEFAEVRRY